MSQREILFRASLAVIVGFSVAACDDEKPEPETSIKPKPLVKTVVTKPNLGSGIEPLMGAWGFLGLVQDDKLPTSVADFVKGKKACERTYTPPESAFEGGIEMAKPPEAMRSGTVIHYPVEDHFQRTVTLSGGTARRIDRIERLPAAEDDEGWIRFTLHKNGAMFPVRVRAMKIIAKPVVVLHEEGGLFMRCPVE